MPTDMPHQGPQNARSAEFPPDPVHRHRYTFPTPVVRDLWIVGVRACGAESRGRAFEANEYEEARSFRGKKRTA